jgi:hypothetical protein
MTSDAGRTDVVKNEKKRWYSSEAKIWALYPFLWRDFGDNGQVPLERRFDAGELGRGLDAGNLALIVEDPGGNGGCLKGV